MRQRLVATVVVGASIEVVDLSPFEKCDSGAPNLLGGPVVQIQLLRAPQNVDAALSHACAVPTVDPLVPVTYKEQVVRPGCHHGAQQLQSLLSEVLRLV